MMRGRRRALVVAPPLFGGHAVAPMHLVPRDLRRSAMRLGRPQVRTFDAMLDMGRAMTAHVDPAMRRPGTRHWRKWRRDRRRSGFLVARRRFRSWLGREPCRLIGGRLLARRWRLFKKCVPGSSRRNQDRKCRSDGKEASNQHEKSPQPRHNMRCSKTKLENRLMRGARAAGRLSIQPRRCTACLGDFDEPQTRKKMGLT